MSLRNVTYGYIERGLYPRRWLDWTPADDRNWDRRPQRLAVSKVAEGSWWGREVKRAATFGDAGGASRFFYCAKPSTRERNEGLPEDMRNTHPTLKPIALTEQLARLLLPPVRSGGVPRRVIVPFSGTGSEMIGAVCAGWEKVCGIELMPEYADIARRRLQHWAGEKG